MSTNLTTQDQINHDLIIAQQEAKILKLELQNLQAKKASKLEDSLFSPALFDHYQKVAGYLSKSGMVPKNYIGKPEDIFVAMAMGYKLGFSIEQSLQDIAVINGRPCLWGDGLLSLALNHPDCEGIEEIPLYKEDVVVGYICTVKRKGHQPHSKTFTIEDAKLAQLFKKAGPWTTYPERMLQLRARSLAIRDKFADALRGLRSAEVEQDIPETIDGEVIHARPPTQTEKLKQALNIGNGGNPHTGFVSQYHQDPLPAPISKSIEEEIVLATQEQVKKAEEIMESKLFTEERKCRMLDYYKISSLYELTAQKIDELIVQLEKS